MLTTYRNGWVVGCLAVSFSITTVQQASGELLHLFLNYKYSVNLGAFNWLISLTMKAHEHKNHHFQKQESNISTRFKEVVDGGHTVIVASGFYSISTATPISGVVGL